MKEFGGYGYRKSLRRKAWCLNVGGNIGLDIQLKDGTRLVLGTQKENELRRIINHIKTGIG